MCTRYRKLNGLNGPPVKYSSAVSSTTSSAISSASVHSRTCGLPRAHSAQPALVSSSMPTIAATGRSGSSMRIQKCTARIVMTWPAIAPQRSRNSQARLVRRTCLVEVGARRSLQMGTARFAVVLRMRPLVTRIPSPAAGSAARPATRSAATTCRSRLLARGCYTGPSVPARWGARRWLGGFDYAYRVLDWARFAVAGASGARARRRGCSSARAKATTTPATTRPRRRKRVRGRRPRPRRRPRRRECGRGRRRGPDDDASKSARRAAPPARATTS